MSFTNYHAVNGRILAESVGTNRKGYLLDALGSVTGLMDATGSLVAQLLYEANGVAKQVSGTPVSSRFGWCGSWGYRASIDIMAIYIRGRSYDPRVALWTSRDALWPKESPYLYARSNPVLHVDPSGMITFEKCRDCPNCDPWPPTPNPVKKAVIKICDLILRCYRDPRCRDRVDATCGTDNTSQAEKSFMNCLRKRCDGTAHWAVICKNDMACVMGKKTDCGFTHWWGGCHTEICTEVRSNACCYDRHGNWYEIQCDVPRSSGLCANLYDTVLHELTHCCNTKDQDNEAADAATCILSMMKITGILPRSTNEF